MRLNNNCNFLLGCIKYYVILCYFMTINTCGFNTKIKMNGQKLETVTSFKYLGSVVTDEGSKPEMLSSIAQTTAALKG